CLNDGKLVNQCYIFSLDSNSKGLMCEILWSDPQPNPGRGPSKRGVGLSFGGDVTKRFLKDNNLELVVRSHEVEDEGYQIEHDGKLITVFLLHTTVTRKVLTCVVCGRLKSAFQIATRSGSVADAHRCPLQPGITECGYYVLKFMKEVVRKGLVVLEQNKIGGDSNVYTDADFDEIREEWLTYACHFIYTDEK
ncbi:hypothetical protein SSX86_031545, partial [Deinandra increscens subsp. villosa]